MQVRVRLFAVARQRAGQAELVLEVPEPVTVGAVKLALAGASAALAPLVPQMMIAVNADYADDDQRLVPPGAEVAAIPPVSGGAMATARYRPALVCETLLHDRDHRITD